jgi:SRSO17 transposase
MSTNTKRHAQLLERPACIEDTEALAAIEAQVIQLFRRRDWQRRGAQYLRALLTAPTMRCNAERLAGVVGANPRAFQRFLSESPWEHRPIIDGLHAYLEPLLQSDDGVWVLEEIGFTKQGNKSVGVACQHNPTLGKRDNCQIGVFLSYASARGRAVVDTRLYLPQSWTNNRLRCEQAGVPDTMPYQSHADLALDMLHIAKERGHLQSRWVTGSGTFGRNSSFRDALDAGGSWYMLEVPTGLGVVAASVALRSAARRVQMIGTLAAQLPLTAWHEGRGSLSHIHRLPISTQ